MFKDVKEWHWIYYKWEIYVAVNPCSIESRRSIRLKAQVTAGKLSQEDVMKANYEFSETFKGNTKEYESLHDKFNEHTKVVMEQTNKFQNTGRKSGNFFRQMNN